METKFKPTLNQLSYLLELLKDKSDGHYDIYDFETYYDAMETKSYDQYSYILSLVYNHKYFEAKKLLDSFGLQHHK